MIHKIFDSAELIPEPWRDAAGGITTSVFNPALLHVDGQLVMAYRVVTPDERRHIAMCRLREDWTVVEGSQSPVSDMLTYADTDDADSKFHATPADPRLVVLGNRLYMHFNTGSTPVPNRIYLVEIDIETLTPIGLVREVVREGRRRAVEKNWIFFEHEQTIFVIYQFAPLTILLADLSDPYRIHCTEVHRHAWDSWVYEDVYGELRGGATPVLYREHYYLVAHSAFTTDAPSESENLCYVGALVTMASTPPFAPELFSHHPLIELTPAEQALPHLPRHDPRCVEAAYPSGAAIDDQGLIVSYGINEKYAALRRVDAVDLASRLIPVNLRPPRPIQLVAARDPKAQDSAEAEAAARLTEGKHVLRAYWWQPVRVNPRSAQRAAELSRGAFVHGNFGDLSVQHLLGRIVGATPRYHANKPKLMTVGSLIQTASDGDVVWGTGLDGSSPYLSHALRRLHVFATRGPISREFLRRRGFDVSRVGVMFDPTSLVPHLFAQEIATIRRDIDGPPRDFILIPHFRDDTAMRHLYSEYEDHIRSVDMPFFAMVREMLQSQLVISSSLHGLIVAEALGVPAIWHRPLRGEDELKFIDYYLGTDRYKIVKVDTLQAAFATSPMPLPTFDAPSMLATFPSLSDLEAYGVLAPREPIAVGQSVPLRLPPPDPVTFVSGWSTPERHGVWSDGYRAELEILIGHKSADDLAIELMMMGYVPTPNRSQRVTLSDGVKPIGSFEITHTAAASVRFPLRGVAMTDGVLRLTFSIATPVSPDSLGLGSDTRQLGIALLALRLRPTEIPTTRDPMPRVRMDGRDLLPISGEGRSYTFHLPAIHGEVRLLTRSANPADRSCTAFELYVGDQRQLGVAVREIVMIRDGITVVIPADDPRLDDGWWGLERHADRQWRWSNGDAILPIGPGGPVILKVMLEHTTFYPLADDEATS